MSLNSVFDEDVDVDVQPTSSDVTETFDPFAVCDPPGWVLARLHPIA